MDKKTDLTANMSSIPSVSNNKPHTNSKKQISTVALLLIISAASGFGGGYLATNRSQELGGASNTTGISAESQQPAKQESELISTIAKKVSPSVVSVNVTGESNDSFFGDTGQTQGAGTGIIISDDGYVVTNRHVVAEGTSSVSVTLSDGTKLEDVKIVGRTSSNDPLDIAFLKIGDTKGRTLSKATIGDSSKVEIGDKVVAIGNALGQFQNTVTDGIISGYGRDLEAGDDYGNSVETLQNLFQTDAAINPGNSGGPLLNINGEVIGVNTAIAGGTAQNIGFAIPSNDISGLINSILKNGKLERPYLGVRYISLTDDYAYNNNLKTKRGAYIPPSQNGYSSIVANSPAAKAGLKEGDIITKIDGVDINEDNSLVSVVGRKGVGDEVTLTIVRDDKTQSIKVKLEASPTN